VGNRATENVIDKFDVLAIRGFSFTRQTPNWPCPPDCLCLPSTSARPRMVSRYGTFGGLSVRST
jgi:hypothetical protein